MFFSTAVKQTIQWFWSEISYVVATSYVYLTAAICIVAFISALLKILQKYKIQEKKIEFVLVFIERLMKTIGKTFAVGLLTILFPIRVLYRLVKKMHEDKSIKFGPFKVLISIIFYVIYFVKLTFEVFAEQFGAITRIILASPTNLDNKFWNEYQHYGEPLPPPKRAQRPTAPVEPATAPPITTARAPPITTARATRQGNRQNVQLRRMDENGEQEVEVSDESEDDKEEAAIGDSNMDYGELGGSMLANPHKLGQKYRLDYWRNNIGPIDKNNHKKEPWCFIPAQAIKDFLREKGVNTRCQSHFSLLNVCQSNNLLEELLIYQFAQ